MRIDIATLFPEVCEKYFEMSVLGRAKEKGVIEFCVHNIRDFVDGSDKHCKTDDSPYGGERGMVMKCQPIASCIEYIKSQTEHTPRLLFMSPRGRTFNQKAANEMSKEEYIIILCGHYEGVDERVLEYYKFEHISLGDFILTGGEVAALAVSDAICRLVRGVLPDESVHLNESFCENNGSQGLLEAPCYTKPREWNGISVPPVLFSGNHSEILKWKQGQAVEITREYRPDLFGND